MFFILLSWDRHDPRLRHIIRMAVLSDSSPGRHGSLFLSAYTVGKFSPCGIHRKSPSHVIQDHKGRACTRSRFHPNCFRPGASASDRNHLFDDNGVTGPDWGRSEVVFSPLPLGMLPATASFSGSFHGLLFSSTFSTQDRFFAGINYNI